MTDKVSGFQGRTVLVVDDNSNNIYVIERLLDVHDITVITSGDGREAIDKLEEEGSHIELVLMDIMMPVMDGLTAIRLLRDKPRFRTLPIIALTANNSKSDKDECMAAGASDYLSKPLSADSLYTMLEAWFWFVDKEKKHAK